MDNQIDVQIDEADLSDIGELSAEQQADPSVDWKAKFTEMAGIARRRTTALKKAKEAMSKPPTVTKKEPDGQTKKGELDYGQKAFLVASGIKEPERIAFVQKIMTESGQQLEAVLASQYVQGELTRMAEEAATKAAMPNAGDRGDAGNVRTEVEYWLKKGELPPPDQVELRRKVVNAKIARANTESNFTSTPVVS